MYRLHDCVLALIGTSFTEVQDALLSFAAVGSYFLNLYSVAHSEAGTARALSYQCWA